MEQDLLGLYERGSEWTTSKVASATSSLDDPSPCDQWDVRTLMNHMLDTQNYFLGTARGEDVSPPSPNPPALLGADPVADFERTRSGMVSAYGAPGVIDKTGPSLGIAFSDLLVHGWDVAKATDQDTTMPEGLPEAAYELIHGRFTPEQRKDLFKPEIDVAADAPAQDKLLAYTGRDPKS